MALSLTLLHTDKQYLIHPPNKQQAFQFAINSIDNGTFSLQQLISQKDSLNQQLESSNFEEKLEKVHISLRNHQASLSLLSEAQTSLSTSLNELSVSSQSPSLLQDLESLQAKLAELQRVRDYVSVIHHALHLSDSSIQSVKNIHLADGAPKSLNSATLEPFSQLQTFISSIRNVLSPARADGAVSLLPFLTELQKRTWDQLRELLSNRLLDAVEKIAWPSSTPYDSISPPDRVSFEVSFLNLLRLQELGISMRTCTATDTLYPLVTLLQPIAQRFHFHFETKRPTNRVDKPEWFFNHILTIIKEHTDFMEGVIKYLVGKTRFTQVSPLDEFTRLLLPLARRKLRSLAYECIYAETPRLGLLANAVGQALLFDKTLVEDGFAVTGTSLGAARIAKSELDKWGVSWEVLGRSEIFDVWVDGEKKFEDDEFFDIISAPDAWALSPSNESDDELMTISSQRVASLLKSTISGTYFSLLPPSHQLIFLTKVILPLIDKYHDRIQKSLDAFDTLSGLLGRAIPGHMADTRGLASNVDMTGGVDGVKKLVKAWVSTKYIQSLLGKWEDELTWIVLWDYVVERRLEVSSDLGYMDLVPDSDDAESVFEVVRGKLESTRRRAEDRIVKQIVGEVNMELKEYISGHWAGDLAWGNDEEDRNSLLLPALQKLTTHLDALPRILLTNLYKSIAAQITRSLTQSPLLTRHRRASFEVGARIKCDFDMWIRICWESLGTIRGSSRVWEPLREIGDIFGMEDEKIAIAEDIISGDVSESGDWQAEMEDKVGILIEETDRETIRDLLRCRDVTRY